MIPASNQKLLVGAVALEVLGADSPVHDRGRAAAAPVGGVVAGDLYLVGGGDPLLTSSTYPVGERPQPGAQRRRRSTRSPTRSSPPGVTQIQGDVVGDGSRYDDEYFAPSWVNDVRGIEAGPYDALLVNDARVTGDPTAGERPGARRGDRS